MKGARALRRLAVLVASATALAACAAPSRSPESGPAIPGGTGALTLESAIRHAHDLGPVAPTQRVGFLLTLAGRDPAAEQARLASGVALSGDAFAARFGPDPAAVAGVRRLLDAAGLSSTWQPGDTQLSVSGPAAAAERLVGVTVHRFRGADGREFYAPARPPSTPASLGGAVLTVTGFDDFVSARTAGLLPADTRGFTPGEAASFYDIKPLYDASLDGTGQTVVFLDWAMPRDQSLQLYAQKFTPKHPFNVAVVSDPASWGAPVQPGDRQWSATAGETALDLEVVHGVAPGAAEVVYTFGSADAIPAVIAAIARRYPRAIVSSSIGPAVACEAEPGARQVATAIDQATSAAAAVGLTIMWASGDRGAYACLPDYPDPDPNGNTEVAVAPDAAARGITAVGGTVVFVGSGGTYAQEGAWGEPVEQWGGGGGASSVIGRPSWQNAPGVPSGMTGRGVPDVAADADSLTGWDIFGPDRRDPSKTAEITVGGTSAAAPFWAAATALIDQDLASKSLPPVGFANPALYAFARSPSGLPAPAFHDVVAGSNLHYQAAAGWDAATGLGSPDVAALADDFEWYGRTHGGSS